MKNYQEIINAKVFRLGAMLFLLLMFDSRSGV